MSPSSLFSRVAFATSAGVIYGTVFQISRVRGLPSASGKAPQQNGSANDSARQKA
jgi:hypothetical protein